MSGECAVIARHIKVCGACFQKIARTCNSPRRERISNRKFVFERAAVVDCGDAAEVGIGCSGFIKDDCACVYGCCACEVGV